MGNVACRSIFCAAHGMNAHTMLNIANWSTQPARSAARKCPCTSAPSLPLKTPIRAIFYFRRAICRTFRVIKTFLSYERVHQQKGKHRCFAQSEDYGDRQQPFQEPRSQIRFQARFGTRCHRTYDGQNHVAQLQVNACSMRKACIPTGCRLFCSSLKRGVSVARRRLPAPRARIPRTPSRRGHSRAAVPAVARRGLAGCSRAGHSLRRSCALSRS